MHTFFIIFIMPLLKPVA